MAEPEWKKYKEAMKFKRTGTTKRSTKGNEILKRETIVIQRLSAEVTGKAQKYSRLGPRDFVPYENEDMSLKKIKEACKSHFASRVGQHLICDVLAGEQGPSCTSLDQIPDLRVVYIRFIEDQGRAVYDDDERPKKFKKAAAEQFKSYPVATKGASPSKTFPKSLSVLEMMKLGKVIKEKTEMMELFSFDLAEMKWSSNLSTAEFSIEEKPFGTGGFRSAFKAESKTPGFRNRVWVVKKYLPTALDIIDKTGQSVESHTQKVVQMHTLARNFAPRLEKILLEEEAVDVYGETLKYNKLYMGKMKEPKHPEVQWVTVEEFIDGEFAKYINNNGKLCHVDSEVRQKCESLAHFSYEYSNGQLMVVDMQGSGYSLFDPEIASKELCDNGEFLFSAGNLSNQAIANFAESHTKCNAFCCLLGFKKFNFK